jgi:hypothetical protein
MSPDFLFDTTDVASYDDTIPPSIDTTRLAAVARQHREKHRGPSVKRLLSEELEARLARDDAAQIVVFFVHDDRFDDIDASCFGLTPEDVRDAKRRVWQAALHVAAGYDDVDGWSDAAERWLARLRSTLLV